MAEKSRVEQIVERAVAQVLETHLPQLQKELVQRVLEEAQPYLGGASGSAEGGISDLRNAIATIHAGTSQKEILRALLESTDAYCGRAALFVVKAGSATGWQGRGLDSQQLKDFALDVDSVAPGQALQTRTAVTAGASDMDSKFISQFGAPVEDRVLLLPLHLKDKVAALVYADGGVDSAGKLNAPALELLVSATSAWLEVASLRKQAAKEGASEAGASEKFESSPAPVAAAPAFSDPFASHAPMHAAAVVEPELPAMAAIAESVPSAAAAAAAAPATDAFAQMSVEDADVHRKAQRFARLLMDEVKLYNQAKVAEGRKHKDLYDRLKEDIDKSRSTYMKRYGTTVAVSIDHFSAEVVRSLAEDDPSILGPNFRR